MSAFAPERSIAVQLIGGLGNQLFQYALGRRLAHERGAELLLDATGFENYKVHDLSLAAFALKPRYLTHEEKEYYEVKPGRAARLVQKFLPGFRKLSFRERTFAYDPSVLSLKPPVYLEGYWQTEKYFLPIESEIRREFTIVPKPEGDNPRLLDEIRRGLAVSLHIRRGDYVSNPQVNQVHGTCSLEYYREAAQLIAGRAGGQPTFYLFSDDPEWVRANLKLDFPSVVVTGNEKKNYEDLRLMSACRHHIIANSSFSWWGAWLNSSREKIVVAPKKWFANATHDTRDLVPEGWLRV